MISCVCRTQRSPVALGARCWRHAGGVFWEDIHGQPRCSCPSATAWLGSG
ncbi:unnamed protein product [Staurois parvus]|uniref:Uncharacterized protein n=1 Tax=Staurois parvus TaxID=386267 RepID=A0ABN9EXT3_9NEOB|nr:unnamed protein product [Staurois parvus]